MSVPHFSIGMHVGASSFQRSARGKNKGPSLNLVMYVMVQEVFLVSFQMR